MKHLALTDHGNLFGALHFEQACRKAGINPVVGCEVYVAPGSRFDKPTTGPRNYHFVLYAKNETGYKNLMYLTSMGYLEGFYYKPRIDDKLLEQHSEGLMASSACLAGEIPRAIVREDWKAATNKALYYKELFGEGNFWLEVMNHGIPEEEQVRHGIRRLQQETNIPIIATNDVHFLSKDHANAQDIFICIATGKKQSDEKRLKTENPEFYFKTEDEMRNLFRDFPDAIENTVALAAQCNLEIPQPGPKLPDYAVPKEYTDKGAYLTDLTYKGLKERYPDAWAAGENSPEWQDLKRRVDVELEILIPMNYDGYFLIVWDFISWARKKGIAVGPGRGSGAGSIVAYALKITDVDPVKYDLLFERFLNPERVSMPDFDIDFCFERRGEVVDYVNQKYGHDNVAGICTFGTLKPKAVLKDVARVLDIPFSEANDISKLIPDTVEGEVEDKDNPGKTKKGKIKISIPLALNNIPELQEFYQRGGNYKTLFDVATILEGMNRHVSTHACGKVIGQTALTNYVPLIKDQKTEDIITAYTMEVLEPCGLVKMDFLGLKTLTLLENCQKLIRKSIPDFDLEKIPENDKTTFTMMSQGHSEAVFQFESAGMQKFLKQVKPSNIEDLVALNALYRPGPMDNIPQYVKCKHGKQKITYPHPSLEETLKPTYGVIVYQEQVMKVAQIIAGFSLGKADILRRAMGKKKLKEMAKMEKDFITGAIANGHTEQLAKNIFDLLIPFADYGFNKSHAVCYAVLAYKTAYCKANYPTEFWAANLTNEINSTETLRQYLAFARADSIKILPPDINLSEQDFSVSDGKIVYGLKGMKGLGQAAADEIIRARTDQGNFESFQDFLDKVDLRCINKRVLETCIQAGLFDRIDSHHRAMLYHNCPALLEIATRKRKDDNSEQLSLFDEEELAATEPEYNWEEAEEWSTADLLEQEKEHLGCYVSGHPLDKYKLLWEKITKINLGDLPEDASGRYCTLVGIVKNLRIITTTNNQQMATAELEDFNGTIEMVLFSRGLEAFGHLLVEDSIIGAKGTIDYRNDKPQFKITELVPPQMIQIPNRVNVHIEMADSIQTLDSIVDFRSFLQEYPGKGRLFLHLTEQGKDIVVAASDDLSVATDDTILDEICGNDAVVHAWKE